MQAYEFCVEVADPGQIVVPDEIANQIPAGAAVRVLILVEEVEYSTNGHSAQPETSLFSLEQLIAEIQTSPSKPEHFHPGSGLLAEHLANPVTEPDPNFDEQAWNLEWDRIEAEMKAEELAHEQEELKSLFV